MLTESNSTPYICQSGSPDSGAYKQVCCHSNLPLLPPIGCRFRPVHEINPYPLLKEGCSYVSVLKTSEIITNQCVKEGKRGSARYRRMATSSDTRSSPRTALSILPPVRVTVT